MKDSSKFELSQELKKFFERAHEEVVSFMGKEISLDHIVSQIVITYLDNEGDIPELRDYLKDLFIGKPSTEEDLREFVMDVMAEIREDNKFTAPSELYTGADSIVLSPAVNYILDKLTDINLKSEMTDDIDTLAFLMCSLPEAEFSKIAKYLVNELDADARDLTSLFWKINDFGTKLGIKDQEDNCEENNGGELKEKTLDYNQGDEDSEKRREEEDREFEMAGQGSNEPLVSGDPNSTTPFLDQYSTNLSKQCRSGQFDPVIGREKEISQVIEILSCRKKSNCVLLGSPGIGKTSVVVGLTQAIESGNVPRELKGKEVRTLDIMGMVSGSTFRGDFEKKLLESLRELVEHPEIIVFIDEMHQIFGAGSNTPGSGDASSLLKPYLSGTAGKITVIAATTDDEYRKFIEKDGALKRRFQEVQVEEPTLEETKIILEKTAPKYEEYHRVKYTPEAIEACVNWSNLYINDRNHPDKDIDIIDIAGSLTKLKKDIDTSSIDNLEKAIDNIVKEKIELVEKQDFDEAQKRRDTELLLKEELKKEKSKIDQELNDPSGWSKVTVDEIASVISKMSKIPIDKIRSTSREKLREMRKTMEAKVIGQNEAVEKLSIALNRQFLGLKDKNKPVSFLFTGSTGTGKSYLTKILNESLFSNPKNLIRVDCSLFTQETSANSLIGAQSGYVGYGDKTVFHDVRKRPFSVILFDEIEKMHENVINTVFLPILDEGQITLSDGSLVSFKNSIVIFTSNIGTREISNKTNLGFSKVSGIESDKEDESIVMKAIKKKFRPELINRLSDIIFFRSLDKNNLYKIFDLELEKLKDRLSENEYTLEVSDKMKEYVVSQCDLAYGARDLQREIVKNIENPISNKLVYSDSIGKNIVVDIDESNKSIVKFNTTIEFDIKKEEKGNILR